MSDFPIPSPPPTLQTGKKKTLPREGSGGSVVFPRVIPKLERVQTLPQGFLPLQAGAGTPGFPDAGIPESAMIPLLPPPPQGQVTSERTGRLLLIGDVVVSNKTPYIHFGEHRYTQAVVVGIQPFVIVSTDARARWAESEISPMDFKSVGKATAMLMRAVLARQRS